MTELKKIAKHIKILNGEMGETRDEIRTMNTRIGNTDIKIAKISTDVCWLKRFFWIIATTSTGALVASLINIVVK